MALRAFKATIALDPDNIGARLFAAECLIHFKQLEEARAEIDAAKAIRKEGEIDKMWLELIKDLERSL